MIKFCKRKDAGVVERDGLENRFSMEIGTRVRIPLFPPAPAILLFYALRIDFTSVVIVATPLLAKKIQFDNLITKPLTWKAQIYIYQNKQKKILPQIFHH